MWEGRRQVFGSTYSRVDNSTFTAPQCQALFLFHHLPLNLLGKP